MLQQLAWLVFVVVAALGRHVVVSLDAASIAIFHCLEVILAALLWRQRNRTHLLPLNLYVSKMLKGAFKATEIKQEARLSLGQPPVLVVSNLQGYEGQ